MRFFVCLFVFCFTIETGMVFIFIQIYRKQLSTDSKIERVEMIQPKDSNKYVHEFDEFGDMND